VSTWADDAGTTPRRSPALRVPDEPDSDQERTGPPLTRIERFPEWGKNFEAGIDAVSLGLFKAFMRMAAVGGAFICLIFLYRVVTEPDLHAIAGTLVGSLLAMISRPIWASINDLVSRIPGGTP
jgi:hypothetical protein